MNLPQVVGALERSIFRSGLPEVTAYMDTLMGPAMGGVSVVAIEKARLRNLRAAVLYARLEPWGA